MADLLFLADVALVALRGVVQVAPVSASTWFVAHGRIGWAVAVGWVISFVWWWNAGTAAAHAGPGWAAVYATGAAAGTWLGQALARRVSTKRCEALDTLTRP